MASCLVSLYLYTDDSMCELLDIFIMGKFMCLQLCLHKSSYVYLCLYVCLCVVYICIPISICVYFYACVCAPMVWVCMCIGAPVLWICMFIPCACGHPGIWLSISRYFWGYTCMSPSKSVCQWKYLWNSMHMPDFFVCLTKERIEKFLLSPAVLLNYSVAIKQILRKASFLGLDCKADNLYTFKTILMIKPYFYYFLN